MEAVKQGSAAVGLRNKDYVVLLAVKRSPGELASYQKKVFEIDEHLGIAIAGLASDARVISTMMRNEALSSRIRLEMAIPTQRIFSMIASKAQKATQFYGGRPFGVGLLVAGYDETGPHLFELMPSGNSLEYHGVSIGARSQSANTFLELKFNEFRNASLEQLVSVGIQSLKDTMAQDQTLDEKNCSIAIVGKNHPFKILSEAESKVYLENVMQ